MARCGENGERGRKPLGMGDEIKFLGARSIVWGEKDCQYSEQKRRKDFKNGRRSEISWAEVKGEVKFELWRRNFKKNRKTT